MTYKILNQQTGRSFETITMFDVGFDAVWRSVKFLFMSGNTVVITDPAGKSRTFRR